MGEVETQRRMCATIVEMDCIGYSREFPYRFFRLVPVGERRRYGPCAGRVPTFSQGHAHAGERQRQQDKGKKKKTRELTPKAATTAMPARPHPSRLRLRASAKAQNSL